MRRATFIAAVLLAPFLSLGASASDPWPTSPDLCATPDDLGSGCTSPYDYDRYLFMVGLDGTPDDYAGGDVWKYTSEMSDFPELNNAEELWGVTGMSVDTAWIRTTGRPDVLIAVLDSGILWGAGDVRLKAFLNRGELPVPAGSTNPIDPHDRDFNGVFNVEDYRGEVPDLNGNGNLDAQDVIRHFEDGVDDDANGFVDDISGWNFVDDTNDPFDEVGFGHGTGEALDSVAEADNGDGMPGICPSCRFVPLRVGQSFVAHDVDYAEAVLYAVDIGASVVQEALGTIDNVPLARDAHEYAYDRGVTIIASAADEAAYHHNFPSAHEHTINVNSVRTWVDPFQVAPRSYLYVNGCTNFGGNVWVSVSSTSCSSEATGRAAGIAGLAYSRALNLVAIGLIAPHPDAASFPSGAALSAAEVRQLFRIAAMDIDMSERRAVVSPVPTVRYASQEGWDQYTGWGRINAERVVAAQKHHVIPPEVTITEPGWWSPHDALQQHSVRVSVDVGVHRDPGAYRYELEYGCGAQPTDWELVHRELAVAPAFRTIATDIPLDEIAATCLITPRPPLHANDFTVVLRATVTAPNGVVVNGNRLTGADLRTIQVSMDPTLASGWPKLLDGSGESSADVVDLDGDGIDEIVVPTAAGTVHAFDIDGNEHPGFPVHTAPLPGLHVGQRAFTSGALDPAAYRDPISAGGTGIADMDGDGDLEIFATSLSGFVYGWDHEGDPLAGFPVELNRAWSLPANRDEHNTVIAGFQASPVLADLDGDGDREIIAASLDRHVYAWHHDGAPVAGFPVHLYDADKVMADPVTHKVTLRPGVSAYRGAMIVSTPAVGDIDGDGTMEIVVGANEHYREPLALSTLSVSATALQQVEGVLSVGNGRLFALEADGTLVDGWPIRVPDLAAQVLPYVGEGVPASPALADIDGDGADEAVIIATAGPVMVYRGDGSGFYGNGPDGLPIGLSMEVVGPLSGAIDLPLLPGLGSPAVGALVPGVPAIVVPALGLGRALDVALPGEQVISQDYIHAYDARTGLALPTWPRPMEDLQFLTTPAIMNVDADPLPEVVEGSGGYLLHAYKASGIEAPGFPKATQHWLIGTPAAGDLDGDGLRELVETSREGWLWVWHTTAVEELSIDEWWSDHHDEANTGRWVDDGPTGASARASASARDAVGGLMVAMAAFGAPVVVRRRLW